MKKGETTTAKTTGSKGSAKGTGKGTTATATATTAKAPAKAKTTSPVATTSKPAGSAKGGASKAATTTAEPYNRRGKRGLRVNLADKAGMAIIAAKVEPTAPVAEAPAKQTRGRGTQLSLIPEAASPDKVRMSPQAQTAKQKADAVAAAKADKPERKKKETLEELQAKAVDHQIAKKNREIQVTNNYDMFNIAESNRNLREPHVKELMVKIARKNLLHSNPLKVSAAMEVLDGQHRLEAAKRLGLKVYYIVDELMTVEDIASINSTAKAWNLPDYVKHYIAEGKDEYVKLQKYIDETGMPIYNAIGLLAGRNSQPNAELISAFKHGEFKVAAGAHKHAERVAKLREKIKPYAEEFYKSKNFTNALSKVVKEPLFDENKLMEKMTKDKMLKNASIDGYVETILNIYNTKVPKKNHLAITQE